MIAPAVQVPQFSAEQVAQIRAAMEALRRQFEAVGKVLHEVFRQIGAAIRRVLPMLVRLADYRRKRLRVMRVEYRRRLRHRRRRAR
ncbi:hypothetical protein [Micromonospora sp. NPDC048839]|uniref:hypothetical protein n=1 Tax=Micromonospora sp. NPDC048839 TaxID=3155641 RepID=UPI0033CDB438